MNPVIEQITDAIRRRSAQGRADYLEQVRLSAEQHPHRKRLSCGNLAHGYAACAEQDKQVIRRSFRSGKLSQPRLLLKRETMGSDTPARPANSAVVLLTAASGSARMVSATLRSAGLSWASCLWIWLRMVVPPCLLQL